MSLSSTSLPKPKNWQDFESKTRELFACILNDPNAQLNGRSGQQQHGVDVYGYRNGKADCLVGVQCKKKYEDQITEKELCTEVIKAADFTPRISEFILVTTAPRDQNIQKVARRITAELNQEGYAIPVYVWGWDDVEEQASKYSNAWKAFDPTWSPFIEEGFEKVSLEIQELKQSFEGAGGDVKTAAVGPTDIESGEGGKNTPRHGQITVLQDLINDGYVNAALEKLLKLKDEEWADSSQSERYRILIGTASAKLRLGDHEAASALLVDAYQIYPDHKDARRNLATGYLLTDHASEAANIARSILKDDESNADAAGILIQSLVDDESYDDPLQCIPEALSETEEVVVAYVHFLRQRNKSSWVDQARKGSEKYPDSTLLKIFSSEAILEEIVQTNRDLIVGGIHPTVSMQEFKEATDFLYSRVRDAIDVGDVLLPSSAHNAALALRLSGDDIKAIEILDEAIKRHPDDENLRLQRALIEYARKGPDSALKILPETPSDPDTIGFMADILSSSGKTGEALALIRDIDEHNVSDYVRFGLLVVRTRAYIDRGEARLAIEEVSRKIAAEPKNLAYRVLQIRNHLLIGDDAAANAAFDEALLLVDGRNDVATRLDLSSIAAKLGRSDKIIELLKGHVATDRENDGLHTLLAASINCGHWVTAHELLSAIPREIRGATWFLRADAILAINTGDPQADIKVAQYIKQHPDDIEMILARISIWQRAGREIDIKQYLNEIDPTELSGHPDQRIRIAALICHYGAPEIGLKYGYTVIMNNWDNPQAHLAYQSLIFLNNDIEGMLSPLDEIGENAAICLLSAGDQRRYRIEGNAHSYFEDERLDPGSDLATLLIGKRPGDKLKLHEHVGAKPVEVVWVKPVYLDAFHRSLEQFNERFPRAEGLLRFTFDPNASDPLEDMRAIVKAGAEAAQRVLGNYQSKNIPLSFIAAILGKDPLEVLVGLPEVGIQFKVCHGLHSEREEALQTIREHGAKGCVVDAITLSLIRRLGVEKAVAGICGPIHTTQSVIDLLATRSFEARQSVGKKKGFMSWRDEQLVYEEYTDDVLNAMADEREKEVSWARGLAIITSTLPKEDHSVETRQVIDLVGNLATDAAMAAQGSDFLLISDDMGFRVWSKIALDNRATWLQPVLIIARDEGLLSLDEYCNAINTLALSGHTYTSLDSNCLMVQARKQNFALTRDLSHLIGLIGGPSADPKTNSVVLTSFVNTIWKECYDEITILRIISEVFDSFSRGRREDQRQVIRFLLEQIENERNIVNRHALNWLVGHSFGMPYFNELVRLQQSTIE